MNKSIFIFAIVIAMAAALPLAEKQAELRALEAALEIPELEIKNKTVLVLENLPLIEVSLMNSTQVNKTEVALLTKQVREETIKAVALDEKLNSTSVKAQKLEELLKEREIKVNEALKELANNLNKTATEENLVHNLLTRINERANMTVRQSLNLTLDQEVRKEIRDDILMVNDLGKEIKNSSLTAATLVEEVSNMTKRADGLVDTVLRGNSQASSLIESLRVPASTEERELNALVLRSLIQQTKEKESNVQTIIKKALEDEVKVQRVISQLENSEKKARQVLLDNQRDENQFKLKERAEHLKTILEQIKEETKNRTELLRKIQSSKDNLNATRVLKETEQARIIEDNQLADQLEREVKADYAKLENITLSIYDKTIEAKNLEKLSLLDDIKSEKLVEDIYLSLNKTETLILNDSKLNKTAQKTLMDEHLKLSKRIKILTDNLNSTQKRAIVAEEIKLLALQKDSFEAKVNASKLESEIRSNEVEAERLQEEIKTDFNNYNLLIKEIDLHENKTTNFTNQLRDQSEQLAQFEKELREDKVKVDKLEMDVTSESVHVSKLEEEAELLKNRTIREILKSVLEPAIALENADDETLIDAVCNTTLKFAYFQPHPRDQHKFIKCDTWGKGEIKTCEDNKLWDSFHSICSNKDMFEIGRNLTIDMQTLEKNSKIFEGLNCNNSQFNCLNNGVCTPFNNTYKCVCTEKFTGDLCEIKIIKNSIFSKIISDNFDLAKFRLKVESNNLTEEIMDNMKHQLKATTHEEIMKYLAMFKKDEIRYDSLMDHLIEHILEDIYPDAYYLSMFNASSESLLEILHTLPLLVSYTKYSKDRYMEVFFRYNQVLEKLVTVLKSQWENVKEEAKQYIKVTGLVLNETKVLDKIMSSEKITKDQINTKLENEFNVTSSTSNLFILSLETLRTNLISELKKKPELASMGLSQINLPQTEQLVNIFEEITARSSQLIQSLFSFGFWIVTEALAA